MHTEFSLEEIRVFVAKDYPSVAARMAKSLLIHFDNHTSNKNEPAAGEKEKEPENEQTKEVCRHEAVSIIETLMQYGNIRPIEGVVYPAGTHKEFLDKAAEWLRRNRS